MTRFKHLRNNVAILLFVICALVFMLPQGAFAEACECFCGNQEVGAQSIDLRDTPNECARACADQDKLYVGCYHDQQFYPENSELCWTQMECEEYQIDIAGTEELYYGTWGHQSAFCSRQPNTGYHMGYCYGPLFPVVLNIPIMGVTEIGSIGQYVNIIYQYAIPVASLVGVLMLTFAGFQYMTAGGDKGRVAKAKSRIVNVVTGLGLLFAVYAIAYLMDPRFTRFNELRPPLIKKSVIVDPFTTCEALQGYGFVIDPSSGNCGEMGIIVDDEEVQQNIANPPEINDSCSFSGCSGLGEACVLSGDRSSGICVTCDDVSDLRNAVNGDDGIDVEPSHAVCSEIARRANEAEQTRAATRGGESNRVYSCFYDNDTSALSGADALGVDECVSFYTNEEPYIDCTWLEDVVRDDEMEDGCDAYEFVNANSYGIFESGGVVEWANYGSADQIEDIKNQFAQLCTQDVCNLANEGTLAQGRCTFQDASTLSEILDAGVFSFFDNYSCIGIRSRDEEEAEEEADAGSSWETPSTF